MRIPSAPASRLVLALAAAAFPATAAHAQDTGDRATHFDGPYVSVAVGATAQPNDGGDSLRFDSNNNGTYGDQVTTIAGTNAFSPGFCHGYYTSPAYGDCRQDRNRPDYAARIGYDRRMGDFVPGILLEVNTNDTRDATSAFSTTPAAYRISRGVDYAVSLRGRLGFTPGGGALFYFTGGPSYARMKHIFATTNTVNQFTPRRSGAWVWGGQVGGGTEVMVTSRVSLGLEYLYNHYRDKKYSVAVTQGTAPATNPFILAGGQTNIKVSDPNYNYHSMRATLSYHF